MRADARRNRNRVLEATIEMVLEVGGEPPLDAVARRAGVGVGTLYRHFPDRDALFGAVVEHVFAANREAAVDAQAAATGYEALRFYLHAAVDRGVGVLNLVAWLLDAPDWTAHRERSADLLSSLVTRCHAEGSIREGIEPADVVFAVIRFSRPVLMGLAKEDERAIAHRHLDLYIDGLGVANERVVARPPAMARFDRTGNARIASGVSNVPGPSHRSTERRTVDEGATP